MCVTKGCTDVDGACSGDSTCCLQTFEAALMRAACAYHPQVYAAVSALCDRSKLHARVVNHNAKDRLVSKRLLQAVLRLDGLRIV